MITAIGAGSRDLIKLFQRRYDIQRGQPRHPVRVIQGQTIGDPTTTIMARQKKLVMPQRTHHFHHVAGHGAF